MIAMVFSLLSVFIFWYFQFSPSASQLWSSMIARYQMIFFAGWFHRAATFIFIIRFFFTIFADVSVTMIAFHYTPFQLGHFASHTVFFFRLRFIFSHYHWAVARFDYCHFFIFISSSDCFLVYIVIFIDWLSFSFRLFLSFWLRYHLLHFLLYWRLSLAAGYCHFFHYIAYAFLSLIFAFTPDFFITALFSFS